MQKDYDAILLVSFGGPEGKEDVIPFLENVLRGKNVPRERMEQVAHHYYLFGGISPINEQCRQLLRLLRTELDEHGIDLPLFWGNRNWHPLLSETVREMTGRGVKRALAFVTSAYSSYSSSEQYLEDIERARNDVGADAPQIDKIPAFYNHPHFIEANARNLERAVEQIPLARRSTMAVVFTAHSIPQRMAASCAYESQLAETCSLVASSAGQKNWQLVFQSRSGPPTQPWLEPQIGDYLKTLKATDKTDVVVLPIGFLSDHMEVIYDLDTEAKNLSEEIGLNFVRAKTVGTDPLFVQMVRELLEQRLSEAKTLVE